MTDSTTDSPVDYDKVFEDFYAHCNKMISHGHLDGDQFDRGGYILSTIWNYELSSISVIYEDLETDDDKKVFIKDFKNTVGWLMTPNCTHDDDIVVQSVLDDRNN